jgi:multiple sugar transport system permease protein
MPTMSTLRKKEAVSAYLFLSPFLIWLVFLMIGPILAAIYLSFCRWNGLSSIHFIGLANYKTMFGFSIHDGHISFNDPRFWASLYNTFYYTILSVPLTMVLGVVVAMMMDQKIKGISFFRTIYYLPSVLSSGVAFAVLWKWIFNARSGLLNYFISFVTTIPIDQCPKWLASPTWSKPALVIMSCWSIGSGMIIYLAGLQNIPQALYEAAEIDGASRWRQFLTVTLPGLSPVIFFNLIISIVFSFQIFNQVYIISNGIGGPANSTLVMVLYIYQKAFQYFQLGYASALSCVLLIIIMVSTWIQFKYANKWVYYEGELRK